MPQVVDSVSPTVTRPAARPSAAGQQGLVPARQSRHPRRQVLLLLAPSAAALVPPPPPGTRLLTAGPSPTITVPERPPPLVEGQVLCWPISPCCPRRWYPCLRSRLRLNPDTKRTAFCEFASLHRWVFAVFWAALHRLSSAHPSISAHTAPAPEPDSSTHSERAADFGARVLLCATHPRFPTPNALKRCCCSCGHSFLAYGADATPAAAAAGRNCSSLTCRVHPALCFVMPPAHCIW